MKRRVETNEPGQSEQYCAASTDVLPARGEEAWVHDPSRRRLVRVPEHLAGLLPHLVRFRTLQEHAVTLRQAGWQEDGSGFLDAVLRELVQRGLLCSRSSFLASLQAVGRSLASPPGITSAVWITRGRPGPLRESLQGFSRNFLSNGRRVGLIVLDDSPGAADRRATRDMLAELDRQTGLPTYFSGLEEKRAFAAELVKAAAREGIPREPIEFALLNPVGFGYTLGANLNTFLLATQGELALKLDDDTFCRFASPLQPEAGLALSDEPDPTRLRLFPDPDALARATPLEETDILQAHESLLGRSAAECVTRLGPVESLRCGELGPDYLQLLTTRPARVAATVTGVSGDSGMSSSRYFLSLTGPERERLVGSEEGYRACLASRQLLRAASGPTLSPRDLFMAMNCGFDNRKLLPPFFPGLRNSDGLFAVVLRACRPEALLGHLPLAGEHRPPERRRFEAEECRTVALRLADLLILLVRSFPVCPVPSSLEEQLPALGRYLMALASAEPADFEALVHRLWAAEMSAYTLHLERLLAHYGEEPVYWAEDVQGLLEAIYRKLEEPAGLRAADLAEAEAAGAEHPIAQDLVRRFGELLVCWPALLAAAGRLREAGVAITARA